MKINVKKVLTRGALGLGVLVLAAAAGAFGWREIARGRTAGQRPQIDPDQGVDELFAAEIGGIPQWFHARGEDRELPVLLYLHGGPGTSMMPFSFVFQNEWENDFIVVQWDQRGAGKTRFASSAEEVDPTIDFERMLGDALDATVMLEQRYGKERIAVLGHSWGTMLGHILVQTHPEHFSVYLATGVVAGVVENETVGYQGTLAIARQRGDEEAVAALASMSIEPLTAEPETGLDG